MGDGVTIALFGERGGPNTLSRMLAFWTPDAAGASVRCGQSVLVSSDRNLGISEAACRSRLISSRACETRGRADYNDRSLGTSPQETSHDHV